MRVEIPKVFFTVKLLTYWSARAILKEARTREKLARPKVKSPRRVRTGDAVAPQC